jgi:cytidine deaminase
MILPLSYLRSATLIALQNNLKYKVGTCLFKNGIKVGLGTNSKKTHPLQKRFKDRNDRIYLHAEIAAIVDAKLSDYKDTIMIVARVLPYHNSFAMSRPCGGCFDAIRAFGVETIVYMDDNNKWMCNYNNIVENVLWQDGKTFVEPILSMFDPTISAPLTAQPLYIRVN